MEKDIAVKIENDSRKEALRTSRKRIICNSLLLASEIIEKNRNVWDLVKSGIVDDRNELVQCVGILVAMQISKERGGSEREILPEKLDFAFGWRYQYLEGDDFAEIAQEYEAIREWLKDPNSKV